MAMRPRFRQEEVRPFSYPSFIQFYWINKIYDAGPCFILYGAQQRFSGEEVVPSSLDPKSDVLSKDVDYAPVTPLWSLDQQQIYNLSARLNLPTNTEANQKLPLVVYYHGGGFCMESPFSNLYHSYLNRLVVAAKVVAISVAYRRPPEGPLPAAYDDSWTALKWIASHVDGHGPEEWLNNHADLNRVFVAGDDAGANIAHQMAIRIGQQKLVGIDLIGSILVHPLFWGKQRIGKEESGKGLLTPEKMNTIWHISCPKSSGVDDPLINPEKDPKLSGLGGKKVHVFVAENDILRDRGWLYYETLKNNGWDGEVKMMEAKGKDHVFHLTNPTSPDAVDMLREIVSFIHE